MKATSRYKVVGEKHPLTKFSTIRTISPVQRFALSEMTRRRKGRQQHSTSMKRFKKPRTGKYWSSVKAESKKSKVDLGGHGLNRIGQVGRRGWRSEPSNIEILGEIARIVTSTKILSGKNKY